MAVTSNRGTGRAPLRPGANPQLEWQYYQNKILKGKAGTNEFFEAIMLLWMTSGYYCWYWCFRSNSRIRIISSLQV